MKSEIQNVFTVTHLPDDPPAGEIRTIASIASDGETIVPKSREFLMFVCFEVRGTNLDGQQVNPLLRSFRKQLENFRLKEGEMKAWPIRVDEFQSELIDSTCVLCSQNIRWNIYNPTGFSYDRIQVKLLRDILTQGLKDEEASITIRMTDALYQGSHRHGRWPKEAITF